MTTVNQPSSKKSKNKGTMSANLPQASDSFNLVEYLKAVKVEWHKITWPQWPQIWAQTIVVLVMTSLMTFALFVLDYSIHFIIRSITPHS